MKKKTDAFLQNIINKLDTISMDYGCELFFPPYSNSNNMFFCCSKRGRQRTSAIIEELDKIGLGHAESFDDNGNIFIEIIIK